jgi:ABC-type transporter Mla MlaB component
MATKQNKRKREATKAGSATSHAAEVVLEMEVSAMSNVSAVAPLTSVATDMIALPASCTVRDAIVMKAGLLPLFDRESAVTIDVRAVERIDAAMLQLLIAFVRDRNQLNRVTSWAGEPQHIPGCIKEAVSILDMNKVLRMRTDNAIGAVAQ